MKKTIIFAGLFVAQSVFAVGNVFNIELRLDPNSDSQCLGHHLDGKFTISQYDSQHANLVSEDGKSHRTFNGDVQNGWTAANFDMDMNNNTSTTEIIQMLGNIYSASRKVTRSDRSLISDTKCEGTVVWLP
jgi:hypothetical protein